MKILIISTLYPPNVVGGAEKAAAELAEALVRHGHEVAVITLHARKTELVEERNGVRVYRLPLENFYWPFVQAEKPNRLYRLAWHIREMWNPVAARRIGRILDAEKPDVVNTHNVCGFSLAAWREVKRRGVRLVHTMHDCYLLCSRSVLFRNGSNCKSRCLDCRLLTANRRGLSRLPDSVVSVSQYTLNEHITRSYYEGVPSTVIFNIHRAMPSRQDDPDGEKKSCDLVFGFIGRVEEEKGIEILLMATGLLQSSNWKLKIAGRGLDEYVQKLSKKYSDPRIEWLGFTDAATFYSSVDVVILPSVLAEALPYVCVESLHAGKSLICVSSGGIPEIARLSSIVEFFPSGDTNALAEKMNLALNSPQAWRESKAPDASKLSGFREEYVVARYLQEYAPQSTKAPRG
ncbi:MAG TPA: glycosyltransferase family 4 protein [Candidatus Sulfotelmatobacter sp.]|jgi:glycosyltransferase involved in cell wall biosynthesis|nr:glycosyltransferase family 4 protein [Candidatus Sulfotelmatobacter sp.]